jgi:AraC-like DNA-binding protein
MERFFSEDQPLIVASDRILYTPSPFARTALMSLQEIGSLQAKKPHASARAGLRSYLFFMVTAGSGMLEYEGREYPLTTGDCVFIDCQKPYSHRTNAEDLWSLKWCHFDGPTLPVIYEKYVERGGRAAFRPEDEGMFLQTWKKLFEQAKGADYVRDMRIHEGLSELLTLLMKESWHPEDSADLPAKKKSVVPIKAWLDAHYAEKITLDDLSAKFYVNKFYLTRVFREQYGMTINAYLLSVRITRAKQLLRFTEKSVEAIGMECGLGAPHYFSRVFKEVEGMSPSRYREQW